VTLLFFAIERYRIPLRDWVLAEQEQSAQRLRLVFLSAVALLLAPLLGFGAYLWSLGRRVIRASTFPPPGLRVIRDTPVISGEAAVLRGRQLKLLALCCGISCVALGLLLLQLAP